MRKNTGTEVLIPLGTSLTITPLIFRICAVWDWAKNFNCDMVLMNDNIACNGMLGVHGMMEEQARDLGFHFIFIEHDLQDSRTVSRQDMRNCACQPGNFWNNDDIAPYGVKLMGGYQFAPVGGEHSGKAQIIRSPGHNSVYFDEATGRWFLIHHTRFASTGDRYIVQTREMWFNDYGWPCVAPTRYVTDDKLPQDADYRPFGTYKVLSHGQDVNTVEHVSVPLQFHEDGTVTGDMNGVFENDGEGRVSLTLDGVEYHGTYAIGYDSDQDAFVTTFTAMSGDGQTLWGIRATGQD